MRTPLILFLSASTFLWADYVRVFNQDGSQLSAFPDPTQERLDKYIAAGKGPIVKADKATADAVTQQEIDDAIAQVQANKKDLLLAKEVEMAHLVAIAKTIAQYTGKTPQEVFTDIKGNMP